MTFQFPSDVSVSVRETLCALCIAIAQVMRRALSKPPPMPMYLTVRRVEYRDRAGGDRLFDPLPPRPLRLSSATRQSSVSVYAWSACRVCFRARR